MAIRIVRNEAGNCINFYGSSNPTYWNACLSGEVDSTDTNSVNVINDIITSETGVTQYEFFRVPFTDFVDRDGNGFADPQTAADYITNNANVVGLSGEGIDLTGESVCFQLDATSTSIVLDNGYHYGVNTIKAVAEGGNISIVSIDTSDSIKHFYNLEVGNACINGSVISGGLNDIINTLNELFTVGAFESIVISDPFSTMVADVDGVDIVSPSYIGNAIDPVGVDVFGSSTSGSLNGYLSTETIDQAGEYFTFDIRVEGTIGFGLVHSQASYDAGYYSGNATYANPANFGTYNSQHGGFQFSHWFHPTPNGSWTNYGANTSYSMKSGWSNFNGTSEQADWLAGNPIKVRVGLDANGFISIETLRNGTDWVVHVRTSYPSVEGVEYRLGIKMGDTNVRLNTLPKVHLLEPAAPTMYFRYIESPDGNFQYPLFATEEEANYYDTIEGGSGTSHTHVYVDDPTNTTWYMPDTNSTMTATVVPTNAQTFEGNAINWTEITSLTNADLIPAAFADTTITVDELSTVNYQLSPVDVGYTTSIGGIPAWTLVDGTTLQGTAPEVTGDNVTNPSDTTTVTVYRTNSYGTSQGTLTINITNLTAPVVTPINGVTHEGGTALIDSDTMDDGSVISIDATVGNGERFVIDKEWLDNYVLPKITSGSGTKSVWIGFEAQGVTPDYTAITNADFKVAYQFYCDDSSRANNNWRLKTHIQGSSFANIGIGSLTSGLYDYVFINEGSTLRAGALVASQGHNASTKLFDANSSDWNWTLYDSSSVGSQKIIIATDGTDLDLDLQYFNEYTEPTAPTILTNWNKALDFSGGSEHLKQVTQSTGSNALRMNGLSQLAAANSDSSKTSDDIYSRPWATAIVFQTPNNTTNQHIWNSGEGVGTGDDNIYLRMSGANGELYFGWGRDGVGYNEYHIGNFGGSYNQSTGQWWGIYISHDGTRLNAANATAANLVNAFDIRLMGTNDVTPVFSNLYNVGNDVSKWTSTGVRMDRAITGDFTIGGRGANRSFHGKVASMVVTTLRKGVTKPTDSEIKLMLTDPMKWEDDYKDGQSARYASSGSNFIYGPLNSNSKYATQIWLMGDGTQDSYANGIRNQVDPNDQNYTKLQLNSMVSNDIQNVNISGLS
jgi:hypothetical protein